MWLNKKESEKALLFKERMKIMDFEGEIDRIWDFGYADIICFDYPKDADGNMRFGCLHFKKGFLTERFPLKTKVKITIETEEKRE
jgi:hypothetical protein